MSYLAFGSLLCALLLLCHTTTPPYLLFSTLDTLSRVNLNGSDYSVIVDNAGSAIVDYHLRLNLLFWAEIPDGAAHQANLDGSNKTEIIDYLYQPGGLAVDWINDNLYILIGDEHQRFDLSYHVAIYDITAGGDYRIIMTSEHWLSPYYYIVVDPFAEHLYWTTTHRLNRSTLSGENVENLLPSSLCIHTLVLIDKLYYFQGCSGQSFRSLNLSTLQESVIMESVDSIDMNGFAVYEETVYLTNDTGIYSLPLAGGGNFSQLLQRSCGGQIRVVHPDLQPDHPWKTTFPPTLSTTSSLLTSSLLTSPLTHSYSIPTISILPSTISNTISNTGFATATCSSLPTELPTESHSSHSFEFYLAAIALGVGLIITISLIVLGVVIVCSKRISKFQRNSHLGSSTEALMTALDNSADDDITPVSVYKMDNVKSENDRAQEPPYSAAVLAEDELLDHSIPPTFDDTKP